MPGHAIGSEGANTFTMLFDVKCNEPVLCNSYCSPSLPPSLPPSCCLGGDKEVCRATGRTNQIT